MMSQGIVLLKLQTHVHTRVKQSAWAKIVGVRELYRKLPQTRQQVAETYFVIRPKHWTTTIHRPTVPIYVDDVYIGRLMGNSFFQDFKAFIDQRKEDSLYDQFTLKRELTRFCEAGYELVNFFAGQRLSSSSNFLVVIIPTLPSIEDVSLDHQPEPFICT
jgi:hypothetical protein